MKEMIIEAKKIVVERQPLKIRFLSLPFDDLEDEHSLKMEHLQRDIELFLLIESYSKLAHRRF
jgi:hypothetical protein